MLVTIDDLDETVGGVNALKRFCTQLQKSKFDVKAALTAWEAQAEREPDYAKSAATHIKSLLGMKGENGKGNLFPIPARAALLAWAETVRFGKGGKKLPVFDSEKYGDLRDKSLVKTFWS